MKIWVLAENWHPRQGGIENYLSGITEELRKAHEVTVITAPAPHGAQVDDPPYIVREKFFSPLVWPRWKPLVRRLARREKPDLIICGKALAEGRIARQLGVPYIVCTYSMEIHTWLGGGRTARQLRAVLEGATAVLHINDGMKDVLVGAGAAVDHLHKVLPGVHERFLRDISPALLEATIRHYGISSPYILSVGRLVPRKGHDLLIEAFAQLDQLRHGTVQLVIVGSGPEEEQLRKIAQKNMVTKNVRFLSEVPDKQLPALYAAADIFALTPHDNAQDQEGYGMVYVEAAAMGTPAIGTAVGGVPEAVISGTTGILVEPSVTAVTKALDELLANTTMREHLGDAARKVAAKKSWRETVQPLASILAEIAQSA